MPIATYSVTVRPEVLPASAVWAFDANWTSVTSEIEINLCIHIGYKERVC